MSMTMEELFEKKNEAKASVPPTIFLPDDIDDDQDICMLMARTDNEVLAEWKRTSEQRALERKVIIVTDDDSGLSEYMVQEPDGSLSAFKEPDAHLGGVRE